MKTLHHLTKIHFWIYITGAFLFFYHARNNDVFGMVLGIGLIVNAIFVELLEQGEHK